MQKEHALITGSSTGIGWATALHLDSMGYQVIAGIRNAEDGVRLQLATQHRIVPLLLDVTSPEQVSAAYQHVREMCGEGGLAALINNAGHNYNSAFEYSDEGLARSMMEVNFFGVVRTSQTFIPLLRLHAQASRRTAKLINVGSIGSLIGLPWESFYHASKFAVLGLTESLRHELYAQRIRATAVLPGGIKTEFARKTSDSVTVAVAGMDDTGRSLYGKGLRRISEMVSLVDRWGSKPELVAKRIVKIVRADNPGLSYVVGTDARLMQAMASLLPRRVLHSMLRPTFGA
jgi:NAD(P)-dependent dehydrogenase (short-subunit alcohol dehydrogenase family)